MTCASFIMIISAATVREQKNKISVTVNMSLANQTLLLMCHQYHLTSLRDLG